MSLHNPIDSITSPAGLFGVGLRNLHLKEVIENKPKIDFFEIHPENFFGYGIEKYFLEKIAQDYRVSFHCVGMSLGSDTGLDYEHLKKIKELKEIINPFTISDHISWSASGNAHLQDLLPLPYNQETLNKLCEKISLVQDYLNTQLLMENPSVYLQLNHDMSEWEFLALLCRQTGCKLLLDINNIYVNSQNHSFNPYDYIDQIKAEYINEIHLAGHLITSLQDRPWRIDTHDNFVCDEVWDLYKYTVQNKGAITTLIEWDQKLPQLGVLINEMQKAKQIAVEMKYVA